MHGKAGLGGWSERGGGDGLDAGTLKVIALDRLNMLRNDLAASRHGLRRQSLCIGQISTRTDHEVGRGEPKNGTQNQSHRLIQHTAQGGLSPAWPTLGEGR